MPDLRTLPRQSPGGGEAKASRSPYLFVVLECHQPSAGGLRVPLDADELIIGRGDERRLVRSGGSLRLELPDPQVSTRHARISAAGGFAIEDLGSTNGTLLHGERLEKAPLP